MFSLSVPVGNSLKIMDPSSIYFESRNVACLSPLGVVPLGIDGEGIGAVKVHGKKQLASTSD